MRFTFQLALFASAFLFLSFTCQAQKIYWLDTFVTSLWSANTDGSEVEEVSDLGAGGAEYMAADPEGGKLYITETGNDFFEIDPSIYRIDLDGSNKEILLTDTPSPDIIALDLINDRLYFNDSEEDKLYRANLDGTNLEELPTPGEFSFFPRYMRIDAENEHIYYSRDNEIWRTDLDGNDPLMLFNNQESGTTLQGITLDVPNNYIYWVEDSGAFGMPTAKLYRADLNGENITQLRDMGDVDLSDLTYSTEENALYISEASPHQILRYNLSNNSLQVIVMDNVGDFYEGLTILPDEMTSSEELVSASAYEMLDVYPNPASNLLNIKGELPEEVSELSIVSTTGKPVLSVDISPYKASMMIDITSIPNGIYFIQAFDAKGKLLSQRKFSILR